MSGCATPRFTPSGEQGKQIEYRIGRVTCDICHKEHTLFKVMNKKKIVCADCYEKYYHK